MADIRTESLLTPTIGILPVGVMMEESPRDSDVLNFASGKEQGCLAADRAVGWQEVPQKCRVDTASHIFTLRFSR